jgi:iron complex outermembrane receptor protein
MNLRKNFTTGELRRTSMAIGLGLSLGLLSTASLAQSSTDVTFGQVAAENATTAKAKQLETITVTGSRISNPNVISPTPMSVLTAADIKATGAINIGDVMTTMPQLATTFTMGNSTRFIGTAGVQSQDLRNLGTDRTLVLVNGRRFVGATAGSTAVRMPSPAWSTSSSRSTTRAPICMCSSAPPSMAASTSSSFR